MTWQSLRAVHQDLGSAGEQAVAEIIRARGHQVRVDGTNHHHDLVVDGSTTVEVKTALPSPGSHRGRADRWQFRLWEDDGQHAPLEEDILVLRCQLERETGNAYHYVIPGSLVPAGIKKIDVTTHPCHYAGKYSLFLEAWELLDATVALHNRDGRQVPLPQAQPLPFEEDR